MTEGEEIQCHSYLGDDESNDGFQNSFVDSDVRRQQQVLLNQIFYSSELEASIILCELANQFLKQDIHQILDNIYRYSTRYDSFCDILFNSTEQWQIKRYSNQSSEDILKLYGQVRCDSSISISNQKQQYDQLLEQLQDILPAQFDYNTDGNILSFLQTRNQIVESKQLFPIFQSVLGIQKDPLICAKQSVVSKHISALSDLQELYFQLQNNAFLTENQKSQIQSILRESVHIDQFKVVEPLQQHLSTVKEADPTMLFNEPQFVEFDKEINSQGELRDSSIDDLACIDDKKSTRSKNEILSCSSSKILADTYFYAKDKNIQKLCKVVTDFMNQLFSDNYPDQIRIPLFNQEIIVNGATYKFDVNGNCLLQSAQYLLYSILIHIANVMKGKPQTQQIDTIEYDVESFTNYFAQNLLKTSFDAEKAEIYSNGHCALSVTFLAIKYLEVDQELNIPDTALFACIYEIEQGYTPTIYHNRMHIADFVQIVLLEVLAIKASYASFIIQKSTQKQSSLTFSSVLPISTQNTTATSFYQQKTSDSSTQNSSAINYQINSSEISLQSQVQQSHSQSNETNQILSPTDIFSIIIASSCHDYGHTGMDNPFSIAVQNQAALLYLDTGPMESAHASLSWGEIITQFSPLFKNFTIQQFREFRIKVVELILATDMTNHFPFIARIEKINSNYILDYFSRVSQKRTNYMDQIFKWFITKTVIKFGDLANPTRSFSVAETWAFNYIQEQRVIGDMYHAFGIEQIQNAQRRDMDMVENSQIGFVNFVLKPFAKQIYRLTQPVFYLTNGQCLYDKLHENMFNTLEIWVERIEDKKILAAKQQEKKK